MCIDARGPGSEGGARGRTAPKSDANPRHEYSINVIRGHALRHVGLSEDTEMCCHSTAISLAEASANEGTTGASDERLRRGQRQARRRDLSGASRQKCTRWCTHPHRAAPGSSSYSCSYEPKA